MQIPRNGRPRTVITALLAPILLGVAPSLAAQTGVPRLERSECPFERGEWARDIQLECAWLVVPEMRDHATGRTVRLAVAVVRAKKPITTPLVMLHGGPGLSGLRIFLPFAASNALAGTRDMVIYDQRGAGYSEPKLCPDYGAIEDSARRLRTTAERDKLWDVRDRACVASLRAQGFDPAAYNTSASRTASRTPSFPCRTPPRSSREAHAAMDARVANQQSPSSRARPPRASSRPRMSGAARAAPRQVVSR